MDTSEKGSCNFRGDILSNANGSVSVKRYRRARKVVAKAVVKHSSLGKRLSGSLKDVVAKYLTP